MSVDASARIVVVGLGDLGRRLALALAGLPEVGELVLAGHPQRGAALAHLAAACGGARTRFVPLDVLDGDAVTSLVVRERPALIIQCASLLSPWRLSGRTDPLATALRRGGFALQLPAQLPAITTLMRALRSAGSTTPVVNCSYPDATHPLLARLGLQPTVGIGNAGMIQALIGATLAARSERRLVRVLAHHSHVTPVVLADPAGCADGPRPRVFLDESGERADDLAFAGPPLDSDRELNALTAAHALAVVRALLPGGAPLRTSLPGPCGLAGGYPVRIAHGEAALDLPPAVSLDEARAFHASSARRDGIADIGPDGTVTFTAAAQQAVAGVAAELAEPLHPDEARRRAQRLRHLIEARS
jgi:hypothetical protein